MRIFLASFLPLAVAAVAGVDSQQGEVSFRPPDAAAASLLVPDDGNAESRLRGNAQALEAAVTNLQRGDDLQAIPDVVDFGELSTFERIEKVGQLQAKLNEWVSKLTEVEYLAVENGVKEFTSILRSAQTNIQKLDKPVGTIVRLLEEEAQREEDALIDVNQDARRLAKEERKKSRRKDKKTTDNRKEERRAYRRMFDDHRQKAKTFHQSHHHLKMVDIQEAIYNGDFAAIKDFTNSVFHSHYSRYGRQGSTASGNHGRRLDKAGMCSQLKECALKMSKYDMFVYFYSDDIDPTTGDVDENIIRYDEKDLNAKYDTVMKLASEDGNCDDLLQQFHRTIENGAVPSWEGATVGQVCIAEGTALFVKLEAAAATLAFTPDKLVAKAVETPEDLSDATSTSSTPEEVPVSKKETTCNNRGTVDYLERHSPDCGTGYAMNAWKVVSCDSKNNKIASSCLPVDSGSPVSKATGCQTSVGKKDQYLDRFDVQCGTNQALQKWHYTKSGCSNSEGKITFSCAQASGYSECSEYMTGCAIVKDEDTQYLDRHNLWCPDGNLMKGFKMDPTDCGADTARFKYNCCKPDPPQYTSERRHDLELIFERTAGSYADLVATLVAEPLTCAEEMYSIGMEGKKEPYPFGDGGETLGLAGQEVTADNVDSLLAGARFPTYEGKDAFPDLPPVEAGWRRKLAPQTSQSIQRMLGTNKASFKITLQNMYLKNNDDAGSQSEFYGELWIKVNGDKQTLWQKSSKDAVDINHKGTYNIGQVKIVDNFDLGGTLEVGGHLWEEDNGSDDDYGSHTKEVSGLFDGTNDFYLEYTESRGILQVNWSVVKTTITAAPTPAPTLAVAIDVIAEEDARDEFGQVRSNQATPYAAFIDYKYLLNQYKVCSKNLGDSVLQELTEKEEKGEEYDLSAVLDEDFFAPFESDCQVPFFQAMREGIEIVFGDRTSTGFICGMKEVVVTQDKDIPGTCCLDAPYELEGDDWGSEYQCPEQGETATCKSFGSYFSGMSPQSCDAYGGTWCPNKVDCSLLRDCIDKYKDESKEENPSFYDYLDSSPHIENPTVFKQCGSSRQYFGYDEYFSNDAQVCDGIGQLKQMNDFSFINDFYGTGSGGAEEPIEDPEEIGEPEFDVPDSKTIAPGEAGVAPPVPEVEEAETTEPDYTESENPLVQSGGEWANSIFAQQQVLENTVSALQFADNVACPWIPFLGTFPCDIVKTAVKYALLIVEKVTAALLKISEFMEQMKAKIDNIKPIKETEEVEAVEENVQVTAEHITTTTNVVNQYIYDSFTALFQDIYDKDKASNAYAAEVNTQQLTTMSDLFETQTKYMTEVAESDNDQFVKIREDIQEVETECVKKIIPGISFDMQAEVASKGETKSFVVVTTGLDGKPTKPDFFDILSVSSVDGTSRSLDKSSFKTKKIGGVGKMFVTLEDSVKENMFIISAGLNEGNSDDELVSKTALVSFV